MQISNSAEVANAILSLKSVGQAVRETFPEHLPSVGRGASLRVHIMGGGLVPTDSLTNMLGGKTDRCSDNFIDCG